MGEATVASCVVFNKQGAEKNFIAALIFTMLKRAMIYAALRASINASLYEVKQSNLAMRNIY